MVSLCHLANKSLLVMAATHAHVRILVQLLVHQIHVHVLTTEQPYPLDNKFQKEITATSAHARIMAKLHVEMKCVDALTKV